MQPFERDVVRIGDRRETVHLERCNVFLEAIHTDDLALAARLGQCLFVLVLARARSQPESSVARKPLEPGSGR